MWFMVSFREAEDYMGAKVTHVITLEDWDANFDQVGISVIYRSIILYCLMGSIEGNSQFTCMETLYIILLLFDVVGSV